VTLLLEDVADALEECIDDPDAFNDYFLNNDEPQGWIPTPGFEECGSWARQREIGQSIVDYRVTVVYSGNMLGKDWWFARIILWWLYTRPDSLVIVTGPTQQQIGSIVWKELRRAVSGVDIPFTAHITAAIQASPQQVNLGSGWGALGFSTKSVERASGQHAGELLVLVIEGSGVEEEIWDAIESLGYSKLAINGNPLRADGQFVRYIRQAELDRADAIPKSRAVNAIRIPSTESPHAHLERSPVGLADATWLSSVGRKYGVKSLWYKCHVEAEIPAVSAEALVPVAWLDFLYAQTRRETPPQHPIHLTRRLSCDLGEGVGRDSSCILVRDDWGVRECLYGAQYGLPEAAAIMSRLGTKWGIPAGRMSYDKLGIGKNFRNHLARYGLAEALPYIGSGSPRDSSFSNIRTESAWLLRNRLDVQFIPDVRSPHQLQIPFTFVPGQYQQRLRDELEPLTYSLVGTQTKLLDKDEWAEILGHSPDVADALIQSFAF
jgi:hypothetical protein